VEVLVSISHHYERWPGLNVYVYPILPMPISATMYLHSVGVSTDEFISFHLEW